MKTKKATKRKCKTAVKAPGPPSREIINKRLAELRALIESDQDMFAARIAQAMETAIIWATEHTKDWKPPAKDALDYARLLRNDLIENDLEKVYFGK